MPRLQIVGRVFFALGFIGLGVTHFIFREFTTGRAPPWPVSMSGGAVWAYFSGAAFILVGLALLTGRKVRIAAISAGIVVLVWALLRQLPIVAADTILGPTWTHAGKALTFIGALFAIAGASPPAGSGGPTWVKRFMNLRDPFITLGRICLAIFLMITGIQHFIYTEFVASLIPNWFPGNAVIWTQFAGVALISGSVGLVIPRTARLAALLSGIMVFSWFWIVHIPRSLGGVSDRIAVYEALAVSGIALMIAGYLYRQRVGSG